jgi:anti-sigma regulatory factor (Ser/Thr protein kinase)
VLDSYLSSFISIGGDEVASDGPGSNRERRAVVLGSITLPGSPEQVSSARSFITRALSRQQRIDSDAATLLTSELVTNAIQHTKSGEPGGSVTVVAIGIPGGILVEVVDDGSSGTPIVKGDLYAAEGHGLYLVQQMAAQWGYLRDAAGTTVWFHLSASVPSAPDDPDGPAAEDRPGPLTVPRQALASPTQILARLPLHTRRREDPSPEHPSA